MKKFLLIILIFLSFISTSLAQYHVSTYAGQVSPGFLNGHTDTATFNLPFGLCRDRHGNTYIAESNHCIRKIDFATGLVTTYAGTGTAGWKDGFADTAQFNNPSDICVDDSGNIYVSDFLNHRIRKIDVNRMVTTIAGTGSPGWQDGMNARFNYPRGICRDANGNLYVGDSWNHRIRKIDPTGNVSTYAGGGTSIGVGSIGSYVDGNDTSARFYTPSGLSIDPLGNIYVADAYNHRIRMIEPARIVTTLAGSGPTGQGLGGYANGSFSTCIFNTPTEIIYDTVSNRLYISDTFNQRIRLADFTTSNVSTLAGSGTSGFVNDIDTLAQFDFPRALAVDSSGDVYVCDFNNNSIRRISMNILHSIASIGNVHMEAYPNPFSSAINLVFEDGQESEIFISDITGKVILNFSKERSPLQVDFSMYPAGVYFLRINSGNGTGCLKLIRN